jgi:tRNA pseudouridine55 synthase
LIFSREVFLARSRLCSWPLSHFRCPFTCDCFEAVFGFLNLNKPQGITSRDAVNSVQKFVRPAKIGHCGTLDPLASGVLVVCVGPATRLTQFVQDAPKTYAGSFRLGVTSKTDDTEGDVLPIESPPIVAAAEVEAVLLDFVGKIEQVPPAFSAIKVNGQRAYDLARRGKEVKLNARQVEIYSLRLTRFSYPDFDLEIQCGSGTYVRSLGRDIAQALGSAAVMTGLVRTAIGNFSIKDSVSPDSISLENVQQSICSAEFGLKNLPSVVLSDEQIAGFEHAVPVDLGAEFKEQAAVAKSEDGRVFAVLRRFEGQLFSPKINFFRHWNA